MRWTPNSRGGDVRDELAGDGVRLEREYDATPEELWDAWTSPERLARWLARPAGPLGPEPVRLSFGDGEDEWAEVRVRQSRPPELLELTWTFPGISESVLRVEIQRLPGGRSRLIVDHGHLGDAAVGYGAGWDAYLQSLRADLTGERTTAWDELFATALPTWRARASAPRESGLRQSRA
jgi:uncharacterized protein YndB with AHSA1/START domain